MIATHWLHAAFRFPTIAIYCYTKRSIRLTLITDLTLSQQISPRHAKSILWIYGDSVSKAFAEYLVTGPYQTICTKLFKECKVTYSWVYNIKRGKVEETVDGKDYSHEKVMYEIIKVTAQSFL